MNIRLILLFYAFQFLLSIHANGQDYNKELDKFYETYREKMKKDGKINADKDFSIDGLLLRPAGENKGGKESSYWKNSSLRVLLLLKDNNGNDGYHNSRNYERVNNNFGRNIAAWIYGLFEIYNKGKKPSLTAAYDVYNQEKSFTERPFAIINIKKKVGKERVSDNEIKDYANAYCKEISKEICVLKPNVIICCGGKGGAVLNYAKDIILSKYSFDKKGSHGLIYYCKTRNLMLIRAYHPSFIASKDKMYTYLMEDFLECVSLLKKQSNNIENE